MINCNEAAREVTVYQSVGGKTLGRSFHYDKVGQSLSALDHRTHYCPMLAVDVPIDCILDVRVRSVVPIWCYQLHEHDTS